MFIEPLKIMISENDKKKIENIKKGLKSIEANLNNLGFVYKIASNLFRLSDILEDNNLKANIKSEVTKIMQTQYRDEIQQAVAAISAFISEAEKIQRKEKRFFPDSIIRKTDDYDKDCEKYSNYRKNINDLENKIISSESYQKNLHDKIQYGKKWIEHYHARLTDNLRLMYTWDPNKKIILFKGIITKNELEKD